MCLFHKWVGVEKVDHAACGQCFVMPDRMRRELVEKHPQGYCPHSFAVCTRCGLAVGYGSHGKLTVIPAGCKKQIAKMRSKL